MKPDTLGGVIGTWNLPRPLLIEMDGQLPVKIYEKDWPEIASHSPSHNLGQSVVVLEHRDGRRLVYIRMHGGNKFGQLISEKDLSGRALYASFLRLFRIMLFGMNEYMIGKAASDLMAKMPARTLV